MRAGARAEERNSRQNIARVTSERVSECRWNGREREMEAKLTRMNDALYCPKGIKRNILSTLLGRKKKNLPPFLSSPSLSLSGHAMWAKKRYPHSLPARARLPDRPPRPSVVLSCDADAPAVCARSSAHRPPCGASELLGAKRATPSRVYPR